MDDKSITPEQESLARVVPITHSVGGTLSPETKVAADPDGVGLACEWGAQIKRISSYRAPVGSGPINRLAAALLL